MNAPHDLAAMTLKDLRQLAGQHQLKNRSKLAKSDIISALEHVIAKRQPGSKPVNKPVEREPEVLDAAAVAGLTKPISTTQTPTPPAEAATSADGDGEPRSKRRRSRRRRKRSRPGDPSDDNAPSAASDESDSQEQGASSPPAPSKPSHKAAPDARERASKGPSPEERPAPAPSRPRTPQPHRRVPPILDRLKTFAQGILELCDPDTPRWAQPRLAELLAEAGVAPIPTEGAAHTDFHDVVDSTADADAAPGHIVSVVSPGFALRGDRGDLFPLRRAKVIVAGTARLRPVAADTAEPAESPAADTPDTIDKAPATPASDSPEPKTSSSTAKDPDPQPTEKTAEKKSPGDVDPDAAEQDQKPPKRRRSARPSQSPPKAVGPVNEEPQPGPAPHAHRAMPNDEAPPLPLRPQEADELAARPQSAGFASLGLNPQILADLADIAYLEPSPIQAEGIPPVLSGRDIIGQAQTGTGKTAAYVLPVLHRLYEWDGGVPVCLVLCPTRELSRQVFAEFNRMAGKSGARAALIYGGVSMDDQLDALARHPHAVIGTPGRIIDHVKRRNLDLSQLRVLVLDEADQMLDIGFLPDIEFILKHTPPQRQTLLFSATMPDEIRRLANKYMRDPHLVHVLPERVTADNVDQKWIAVDPKRKTSLLSHLVETLEPEKMVVFCRTKHQTDRVAEVLKRRKIKAAAIHGDLPQSKRERALKDFTEGKLACLIATNVAARGLDIPAVSHVINYDIPENPEEYVHRIGRTARMGRTGIARTFITPDDGQFLLEIEKHIGELLEEEVIEDMQTTSSEAAPKRTIAAPTTATNRLLKPLLGGIRLGRRRK